MCGGGSPPPVQEVERPAPPPKPLDQGVVQAGDDERRRIANARGSGSTVLTSATGASGQANLARATVLGGA